MKSQAVHFGAGNIGRGFIGEVLHQNNFDITFVDINEKVINALNERQSYEIGYVAEEKKTIHIDRVGGINNQTHPEEVVEALVKADLVTTAIGANILPFIAPLIAQGIQKRQAEGRTDSLDVIACENMIGGSTFLKEEVKKHLTVDQIDYLEKFIGFPNAAVDRIVPEQAHEDPLYVEVEPFSEWIIETKDLRRKEIQLEDVLYVEDLMPFIERKLFSVNTGHATVAYLGAQAGYKMIDEAMKDEAIVTSLRDVLTETGNLMINKWDFAQTEMNAYHDIIVERFSNPYIKDEITRVARTPIRKLGYDERFVRPLREARERDLSYDALLNVISAIFEYDDVNDEQSQELHQMLDAQPMDQVIRTVTEIKDDQLIQEIEAVIQSTEK